MNSLDQRKKGLVHDFSRNFYKLRAGVSPKKVHRLRTSIRRIESFIDLSGSKRGHKHKDILEELTNLRKRAGKVRNFDVQMRLLGSIANGSTISDRRILVQIFKAKREKQSHRLSSLLKKVDKAELVSRLEKLISKTSLAAASKRPVDALERARSQIMRLAAEVPAGENLKPRRLHELRISLKRIRYTAELAEESATRAHLLETLKSVQDAIGEWHDWESLVKIAEKQFGDRVNCPLLVEMRALFNAKYSAAKSAAVSLRESFTPVPKKHPRPASLAPRQARVA